jgi:hypothetical protein
MFYIKLKYIKKINIKLNIKDKSKCIFFHYINVLCKVNYIKRINIKSNIRTLKMKKKSVKKKVKRKEKW